MGARPFVIFDRDGTLIEDRHYLSDPEGVRLIDGTGESLRRLADGGFRFVVLSNQSGIGRGYFTHAEAALVNRRLGELLAGEGVTLEGVYYCPHTPTDGCKCRKPEPALVEKAATDLEFDPTQSIVVGDRPGDIELGKRVRATTVLVRTGYGHRVEGQVVPDYVANSVHEATPFIMKRETERNNRVIEL